MVFVTGPHKVTSLRSVIETSREVTFDAVIGFQFTCSELSPASLKKASVVESVPPSIPFMLLVDDSELASDSVMIGLPLEQAASNALKLSAKILNPKLRAIILIFIGISSPRL